MARLALRAVVGSLVLSFCILAGCTPGGGSGTSQPAPASASPVDRDGY